MEAQKQILLDLYKDKRTVFPLTSIALSYIDDKTSRSSLLQRLNYYVTDGSLVNVRKGIYAKPGYDGKEMACSIYAPSYLSLEYVLQRAGVIFQYDEAYTCVSYLSRSLVIGNAEYRFRKIKNEILINTAGIIAENNVNIATPERAFLDVLYLDSNYYFDNLLPLDKEKIFSILPIYGCKTLAARVSKILK